MRDELDVTLTQLRYFVAAAEAGNMTEAARTLFVSQPSISTAVAHLEETLGVQLFLRHHARGLSVTQAGTQVLTDARSLLAQARELADRGRSLGKEPSGNLSVGCFLTLSPFYLPQILANWSVQFPKIRLSVREGTTEGLQTDLLAGDCELALLYGLELSEELETEVLCAAPPYIALPEGHRLAGSAGLWLAELAGEPMVLLDLPMDREYFLSLLFMANVEPAVIHRSPNYETVRTLVANGYGFSILNQRPLISTTYNGSRVVVVPVLDPVRPIDVVLATVRGARLSERASAFASWCRIALAARDTLA